MLTLDVLYDPKTKINFDGTVPGLSWSKDGEYCFQRKADPKSQKTEWMRVHAVTGIATPLFESLRLEAQARCTLNPNGTALLFTHGNDLFYCRSGRADEVEPIRLAGGVDTIIGEQFSPDGKMVSFVRNYDLWMFDIASGRERELTAGGNERLLNGRLDWVYQEEIYGSGNFKGYWWSPDSENIAYLSLDESDVTLHTLVDRIAPHPGLEVMNYPKAGDPNPKASLGIVSTVTGKNRWVDLSKYGSEEFLIVRAGWTPDSLRVVYQIQDREQRWLDLNVGSATLIEERSPAWVGVCGEPHWLKDGSFLWTSERTGWKHLYHYTTDDKLATLIRPVTSGQWEVRSLLGVDEARGFVYFSGTEYSPIASHTYRIRLDGTGLKRLTAAEGTHRSVFNQKFTHFIDYWSDIDTPTQVRLFTADGDEVRVIDANPVAELKQYRLRTPKLLQVKTRDGFDMEALMIKPPDFDSTHK